MIKRNALWLSIAIACGLLASSNLYAQDAEAVTDQPDEQLNDEPLDEDAVGQANDSDDSADSSADLERIAVTGSLIRRNNADTLEPSVIIDAELLENRGINNIADILNETPAFGAAAAAPQAGEVVGSIGQNFVDFLGLGSQRTLTVVNGRRFVSASLPSQLFGAGSGLEVDFNALPVALIEEIETISVGGSPTYGTDALAGTINVKYRTDFEGFEVGAQYGIYDIGGDPESVQVNAVWGANFADRRGNVAIAAEYNIQDGLDSFARPLFTDNDPTFRLQNGVNELFFDRDVVLVTFDGNISPEGVPFSPFLTFGGAFPDGAGAIGGEFYRFNGNGDVITCNPGTVDPQAPAVSSVETTPTTPNPTTCGDDFFEAVAQRQSPLKRLTLTGVGHYDITDNITAFMEFNAFNAEASELLNQAGFSTPFFGGESNALTFSSTHPLLSQQATSTLQSLGLDTFSLNRANQDLLNGGPGFSENTTLRVVAGLNGGFSLFNRQWDWEVYTNFGETDAQTASSDINDARLINALDAVAITQDDADALNGFNGASIGLTGPFPILGIRDGNLITSTTATPLQAGDVVCQSLIDVANGDLAPVAGSGLTDEQLPFVNGCVPVNLFGDGNSLPEAVAFVQGIDFFDAEITQEVTQVTVGTDLFDLPAGPVGIALGYQHREERAEFDVSTFASAGFGRGAPPQPTAGGFNTEEFFGEIFIPVLSPGDIPFINTLNIEAKGRIVENSLAGTDSTYTLGGTFTTIGDFRVAGNFTQSIRAPSVSELFAPNTPIFSFADDPCDVDFIGQNPNRAVNCAAAGFPADFQSNVADGTAQGVTGGNPNLQNEIARSWTAGLAWIPSYVPGLIISADYINIDIGDRIELVGLEQVLESCFDADPANFPNAFCDQVVRDANLQVIDFDVGFANAASSEFEAVVFDARYDTTVGSVLSIFDSGLANADWGTVSWRVNGIRRITNDLTISGVDSNPFEIGSFNAPDWSLTFDTNYRLGKFGFFWRTIFQSAICINADCDETANFEGEIIDDTGNRFLHNAGVFYEVTDGLVARVTVNNVANRRGSLADRAAGNISTLSEILGRQYLFSMRWSF